ncbi:MAG: hypothetical protein R3266_03810 [Gemmatimonadota bacterium]|nr:hypothetical protein [Gemmatimonadota bacterium]
MSKGREFRAFDYVNRPYGKVRDALLADAEEIFRKATRAAASRAHEVASGLHVNIGGLEIGAEIDITISETDELPGSRPWEARTRLTLEWEAAKNPRLFPELEGELDVYALTERETQLDFGGRYRPPMGPLGGAIDSLILHRVAEASIHRFVTDVARYLRENLAD